jgi:Heterokaryon incompatibility protein (HET)
LACTSVDLNVPSYHEYHDWGPASSSLDSNELYLLCKLRDEMERTLCLPQAPRSAQLLTPPEIWDDKSSTSRLMSLSILFQSSSTADSPVFVDDASTAALSPLRTPPNSSDSELAQPSVGRSIISRPDHAQKRKLDSIESESKQERKRRDVSVQNDLICEECRQIDFQKVLDLNADTLQETRNSRGVFIANLATRCSEPSEHSCALCRVFSAGRLPVHSYQKYARYQLRTYSFLKNNNSMSFPFLPKELKNKDQPYLAVVPPDFDGKSIESETERVSHIFCYTKDAEQPGIFAPQVVPRCLDYSAVVRWLNYCRSHHKRLCSSKETQLPGSKLIDCNSLSVTPAPPSSLYAALSYVWGRSEHSSCNLNAVCTDATYTLPTSLPKVISDGIIVTKALGLQYLWADKFCIDQENPNEKHDQISRMDVVYKRAETTIIAAAGDDENCGLPGIGTKPRRRQLAAKVGNIRVISSLAHPHHTIASSKWSTRRWTYQEVVLSRRRLVFTEDQTYFECNAMNCYESVQGILDVLHTKNKSKYLRILHSGIFSGKMKHCFNPMDAENLSRLASLQVNFDHIQQFSKRDLTFEHDSLQAFAGINRHLETSKFPMLQLWGSAISASKPIGNFAKGRQVSMVGLLWRHQQNYWSTPSKPYRRSGFPSWSWAGWAEGAEFVIDPTIDYQNFSS